MKITWNWLLELVELDLSLDEVAERLTMSGLELESVEERGREIADVRCAEVISTRRHPNADRLTVCEVRTSDQEIVTVVCGAPNVRAGLRVAHARPGSTLPGGKRIDAAEIRGVASAGMLCSEVELGIGDNDDGILELPADMEIGQSVGIAVGYTDTVLEIGITPNRGDCLSVLGIAREIAALTGRPLRRQRISVSETGPACGELASVTIADPDLCGRYVARVISGIKIAPSPRWMQYRLQAIGMRAINNVVDITNYVMMERGQPLHAFDYDRLANPGIVVRRAGKDSSFTTLDDQERRLQADDLVISTGEQVVALAGVMGGSNSEVHEGTQRILLESAWFAPSSIRRTSRRLGLKSEASYRFERATDIEGIPSAADRAAALLLKLAGGRVARGRVDAYPGARPVAPISLRMSRIHDLLGMNLGKPEVTAKLKALGMNVTPATRGVLNVVPPSFRTDLTREVDLIEEVVRLCGYQNVPTTLPECALSGAEEPFDRRRIRQLREALASLGMTETVPLSFCSPRLNQLFPGLGSPRRPVTILNPIVADEGQLHLSLCSGLIRAAQHNAAQATHRFASFVVGKTFWQEDDYQESRRLAVVVANGFPTTGLGTHDSVVDFADVKGIAEGLLDLLRAPEATWTPCTDVASLHPGKSAHITIDQREVGVLGSLHPSTLEELGLPDPCWILELDLDFLLQYGGASVIFKELQRFPAVIRDVAVVAESTFASDQVIRFVRQWATTHPFVEDVALFDEYSGPPIPSGKKSLAYTISFRAADRTLTDGEINEAHSELKRALVGSLPIELR